MDRMKQLVLVFINVLAFWIGCKVMLIEILVVVWFIDK